MSRKYVITFSLVGLFLLVLAFNLIWNAVVPNVFGFKPINYLEALGLMIIARLLFGGFGRHFHHLGLLGRWRGLSHKDRDSIMSSHGFCRPFHHHGGDGHHGHRFGDRHSAGHSDCRGEGHDERPERGHERRRANQDCQKDEIPGEGQGAESKAGEDSGPKPNHD
ncbi:MAG: hypothetical protein LBS60_02895 [Deltaproteobacteria bacterium]|nr:hypothetical protein [Deltaproteobacteria bacterium]